ncbi:type II toxin-antitoxin system death-on-curing family toxin [Citrobacter portucalensis]|uniref:type II toxin-antitoxin system death-on-curing family toxin n=1 Tax=Enterobacteriaceae TaxID=543 RepID=UPI00128C5583|nr:MULTISPECIES: type II toxin-antitoxin system death-on-curing family toxin [Enterobacteriaceae]EJK2768423.1 type II toxin-antitoxin system death-on-curing family toxin [Escherichia coli]HBM7635469.1 type II toxin-antitoxin system death-on-curing family toxin [Enterobacter asburiae]HCD1360278.1 type II toxin-antitoxin system death-on-curing family toxin [Klebsiella pneumoniae subsp. pneumoniae]ELR3245683.1 type II toxin-antitoxin system death-on-curing family toxin [Escherichia coli]MBW421561
MDEIQFNYFDIEHAIAVHDHIIERSGGLQGIRDRGVLESVLDHIQNDWYYPSFESKLTHLFFSVNKLHAFTDGNKRSGIFLSAFFLEINGFEHCVKLFVQEMENIAVWVADGAVSKDLLQQIIHDLVLCEELLESTKLELAMAIMDHQNNIHEGD